MLSVYQTRTILWERDASELDDSQMTTIASAMLNEPALWTELAIGKVQTSIIMLESRRVLVVVDCLNPLDDIQLQILSAQDI